MFQKQPMMRRVLYSLVPLFLVSFYLYTFKAIILTVAVFVAGIGTEYVYTKKRGQKVTEAVLVTCALYALSLPPGSPIWISILGIIFGVLFGKLIYGGFGRNVFNPAIVGRLFVYITFPISFNHFYDPRAIVDGLSGATPLTLFRNGVDIGLDKLFLGNYNGSIGETSSILIILAGIYLIYTKTANWKLMASTFTSFFLLQTALYFTGVTNAISPIDAVLSGSFLFVTVFMVTDPVTAPKQTMSIWLYGVLIGVSVCLIRTFSLFPEGTSFAILLGNTFAPLFDEISRRIKSKGGAK